MFYEKKLEYAKEIEKQKDLVKIIRDLRYLENKFKSIDLDNLTEKDKKIISSYKDLISLLYKNYALEDRLEYEYDNRPKLDKFTSREDLKKKQSLFDKVVNDKNELAKKVFFVYSNSTIKLLKRLQTNLIKLKSDSTKNNKHEISIEDEFYISSDGLIWSSEEEYKKNNPDIVEKIDYDISFEKKNLIEEKDLDLNFKNDKLGNIDDISFQKSTIKKDINLEELANKIADLEEEFKKVDFSSLDDLSFKLIQEYQQSIIKLNIDYSILQKTTLSNCCLSVMVILPLSAIKNNSQRNDKYLELSRMMSIFQKLDLNSNDIDLRFLKDLQQSLINYNLENKQFQKKI